jgi:pimeloyl-ACP methyl ester carboxylesterase
MLKTPIAVSLLLSACVATVGDDDGECTNGKCDAQDLEVAHDLPEHCTGPELLRIKRPVYSEDPNGDTFAYGYRFKAPTAEGAPVIVYLPGGPGQASTENPPGFVPPGWGYLMTDPRGVGCNRLAQLPSGATSGRFFSTAEIANDVIAAIEDRRLEHYILFGISYGSALGTTVAHEIEARGVTKPDQVVLEGVLGKTFGKGASDFPGAEYITQWHRVRDVLPADVRTELDTAEQPYGFDRTTWSKFLMENIPRGPGDTLNIVAALSTEQPQDVRQQILDMLTASRDAPPQKAGENELYRQVACREIMDTVPDSGLDVVFERGDLVRNKAEEGTKCKDLHVTTPYDAAELPFSMPLFLFVGDSDAATPAWQGAYHFEHHAGGPVTRILTRNGGHNSLELNQIDCAATLMASIATGGADLAQAATGCPMQTTIEKR